MTDSTTSLNKFISQTGICSRREADRWIEAGRVRLNGKVARKGNRVGPGDKVTLDGQPLHTENELVYILLNKPPGITCTTDLKDKDNIIDFVGHPERIFPVGRLDKPSTGLIMLTNDGDIVNRILRAEHNHEKEYVVTVNKPITKEFVRRMAGGLPILGKTTKKCEVEQLSKFAFRIVLTQGMNRQIRRMCEYLDYRVVTLKRVRIMNLHLKNLHEGHWRELTEKELNTLKMALK